jgi:hypothetical protein
MNFIIYIKKKLLKFKNILFFKFKTSHFLRVSSYPYISGDSFLCIADGCIIDKNKPVFIKFTNKKNIIFIENSLLSIDWILKIAKQYKKVILHNGDSIPNSKVLNQLAKNKIYVFGTNIKSKNKYINPIPIGIENAYLGRNGNLNYYNPLNIAKLNKEKKNILLVSFSVKTNPKVRKRYELILKNYNYENTYYKDLGDYRKVLSNSYFVISPPGNGIDCHRTWEAFIHKTIPIIEKKYYLFDHINLPILIVDNLKEFLDSTYNEKLKLYKKIIENSTETIYMQWWIDYINMKNLKN